PLSSPTSTPCPYTTLFRSGRVAEHDQPQRDPAVRGSVPAVAARGRGLGPGDGAPGQRRLPHEHPGQETPRERGAGGRVPDDSRGDRKSTRLNSSHVKISYA